MATRISLIHAALTREQEGFSSAVTQGLLGTKKSCLIRIAQAAREASLPQIALKSITSALNLEEKGNPHFDTSYEFAHVLWAHREETMAIEHVGRLMSNLDDLSPITQANSLSQQVTYLCVQ